MTTQLLTRKTLLTCTPAQVTGPFYPGDDAFTWRQDLTRLPGNAERASGEVVLVRGDVRDARGLPVPGAVVKVWQACASGRYNDSRDTNPSPLDPNFAYWGMSSTDAEGAFEFRTVKPGEYKDTETWTRPPHLHFRISAPGFQELTTQMYFAGNPLNEKDLILENTPRSQWGQLVVGFRSAGGVLAGEFRIVLLSAV